ncbi:MAG: metalloregulator ArsR/SmtB family transcription factor [Lachnospiraceae bacterium]|nr:metalloregulator ArsR/SmtB family transcription factor [Lachnospiraceae bacterium]
MTKRAEAAEVCEIHKIHKELLRSVSEAMPEDERLYELAELFKIFGDQTRIRILCVLFEAEVCVCDIAEALNMTQSAISHQLRILKTNRLIKGRREGKQIFYSLDDEHVRSIIGAGMAHICEDD